MQQRSGPESTRDGDQGHMNFLGVVLEVGMQRDDIIKLMRQMRDFRETHDDAMITASIFGFEHDPRELWWIPEVKTLSD